MMLCRTRSECNVAVLACLLVAMGVIRATPMSATTRAPQALPEAAGKDAVERLCSGCHDLTFTMSTRETEARWTAIVNDMRSRGADGTEAEFAQVIAYLAANMGVPVKHMQVDLIANRTRVAAGERFALGLRFGSADGWQAQGVTVAWTMPPGVSLAEAQHDPAPTGGAVQPYANGDVRAFAVVAPERSVPQDTATIRGRVSYQACNGGCVSESADVTLLIPIGAGGGPANISDFARAR